MIPPFVLCENARAVRRMNNVVPATHVQVKYRTPSFTPSCFPRWGSSHSTPSQVPAVPSTGPTNLMVPMCPEREIRVPTFGGLLIVEVYFCSGSQVIAVLYSPIFRAAEQSHARRSAEPANRRSRSVLRLLSLPPDLT